MDLRQLSALVAIDDHGSFSAAADALQTVQSNVSAHVKKLERELGCELVDRTNGHLTEAGELVVARARRVQAELDALLSDVVALTHDVAGTVRIGIIGTTARWLVPRLMSVAPQRYPQLRLVFVESTTTRLDAQLATGQVDLAVLNLPTTGTDISVTPLFEEDLVLVVPIGHPLAAERELSVRALEGIPLLLPVPGTAFRAELEAAAAATGTRLLARAEVDGARLDRDFDVRGLGTRDPAGHRCAELSPRPLGARKGRRDSPPAHRRRSTGDGLALGTGACRARPAHRRRLRPGEDSRRVDACAS